ncbi:rhomboid family intramembrane serine protease [Microvirga massiliensis]|uniref:rhomboid family intramembrane serine protease n=1 Tax=Microvirga massiliensis TaxID=1033741 RepID=UPI00062BC1D4|nr:rhomboid family intramembrane serine protease [Microvirga massiliensis]
MFLPLHDGIPLQHLKTPFATRLLIALCVAAYFLTFFGPIGEDWVVAGFGLIPSVLFGTEALPEGLPFIPPQLTLVTSIFLHGSFIHLAGNMLFLWVFGDNVEDAMGHGRFILFFILCGAVAGLAHALIDPESGRPLIGASGAVSGVVAAYLILYPRVRVWGLFLKGIPLRVPAFWAIGFWFLLQLGAALVGGDDGVGWFAHLGGFLAGAILIPVMRRRYDPVLARVEAQAQPGA